MKILYLSLRFPYPPHSGDKIRTYNVLKKLSENHSIHFISFCHPSQGSELNKQLAEYCDKIETASFSKLRAYKNCLLYFSFAEPFQINYWHSREMQRKIDRALESSDFDLIHVQFFRMAQYVRKYNNIPKLLDSCDSYALNLSRRAKLDRGLSWPLLIVETNRVKKYEVEIARHFNSVTLVSPLDMNCLYSLDKNIPLSVVPMGVDLEYYQPGNEAYGPNLLFTGTIKYFPNSDAILYFYNEIFPIIKNAVPDVKFYVVGNLPPKKIRKLEAGGDVIVTGRVEDVRPYFDKSAVFVCPLRSGSGMQTKILESMAMGVPVVTSSMGVQALEASIGKDILVSDKPEEFAQKVISLLKDRERRQSIAQNSRKLVEEKYGWSTIVKRFDAIYKKIVR
jgi:sugar transferase (PEP-CTERM/EpsH1 system associated)